jgi:hypothetical protein
MKKNQEDFCNHTKLSNKDAGMFLTICLAATLLFVGFIGWIDYAVTLGSMGL